MDKNYSMQDLGIKSLVGLTVLKAEINDSNDLIVLTTDKGPRYLTWEGDCCARCFLAHVNNTDALLNAKITQIQDNLWEDVKSEDYKVIESMGTTFYTSKGTITFESRLEHNGYYSGDIKVSDDEPIDQYSSPREDWQKDTLRPLKDF